MILKISAVALLTAIMCVVLSELGFKSRRLISVFGMLIILISSISCLENFMSEIMRVSEVAKMTDAARCALKTVGVGYLFGFVSSVLSELNENTLAFAVSIVSRLEIMLLVLPYLKKIINLGLELLQ